LTCVAFAPDGTQVASGSHDRTIGIYDTQTGQELRKLVGHEAAVLDIAYSPDGRNLASTSADRTLKIWNLQTGDAQRTLSGHASPVTQVVFTVDGQNLISGAQDGEIRYWPLLTSDSAFELRGHTDAVQALAVSRDQKWRSTNFRLGLGCGKKGTFGSAAFDDSARPVRKRAWAGFQPGQRQTSLGQRKSRTDLMGSRNWPGGF
jgi:WD40 repeat protein